MPKRETIFQKGGYYHLYNRGINQNLIFFDNENYIFLLKKIKRYSSEYNISVLAYCLMPNHYHMLVRQDGRHNASTFIQAIFNSYTKAINKRHNRSGTLFEGRFQSIQVDDQNYLIYLCSYIHRNPIEANITKTLGDWPYSNLPEWLDNRNGQLFDKNFRNSYFTSAREYLTFLTGYDLPATSKKYLLE